MNDYGTFNGQPMKMYLNRDERREYIKTHKKDNQATICPHCKNKTLKITDDNGELVCELCGKIIKN